MLTVPDNVSLIEAMYQVQQSQIGYEFYNCDEESSKIEENLITQKNYQKLAYANVDYGTIHGDSTACGEAFPFLRTS